MPNWIKRISPEILAANPEFAAALRSKHTRARLASETTRKYEDKAPMFLYAWRMSGAEARAHFPEPVAEYEFMESRGFQFDWAWIAYLVAVEVDGGQHAQGGGRHATDGDRVKMNEAAARGWLVLHFSPEQLESDPAGAVALAIRALQEHDFKF